VLGNDVDIDGDMLSVQSVDGFVSKLATDVAGAYGTFHVNADGSYTYTLDNTNARMNALNNGQTLTDHLTYTVADPSGETSTAELVVTIDGATDPFSVRPPASTGGNDTLIGGSGNEVIDALAGNDRIESGAGNDVVYAGDSSNTLSFAAVEGHAFMERSTQNLTDNNGALRTAVYEPNADVANGGSGNDALFGESGSDLLYGGAGNDYLSGGDGIDGLRGGGGNDRLEGGAGSDVLRGDAGADVFAWSLGDQASTFGTANAGSGNAYDVGSSVRLSSTADLVTDFNTTDTTEGDKLDLRDLLHGEHHLGANPGNLSDYLHFELSNGHTVVHVSTTGGFSGGYNEASENQTIVLQSVDLTRDSGGVSLLNDNAIVQDLLKNGRLIVD
jgi:VCBS repeat-containing protein